MVFGKGSTKKSNLDRFLHCTTPLVPPQSLPKAEIRSLNRIWHPWEREKVEFFRLSDLWDCYDEWSAYGAGVPIRLTNGESLVQYYVPYLSAIQIFTSRSSLIRLRDDSEDGESRDSFSDSYSCYRLMRDEHISIDKDGMQKYAKRHTYGGVSSREAAELVRVGAAATELFFVGRQLGYDLVESRRDHVTISVSSDEDGRSHVGDIMRSLYNSDESESDKLSRCASEEGLDHDALLHPNDRLGYLYLQYFERSAPYARVPLMDKINELAQRYPGLMSLRSVDLSPASWMAVAWYPIYHIPMGRTIKDLSTCFLSYHTLSSSFQDMEPEENGGEKERTRKEGEGVTLLPFGLATYKMQGNVWLSEDDQGQDQERVVSLLSVADSWLKQLRVQHHDFNYFSRMAHRG